jgi:hypothetical protein
MTPRPPVPAASDRSKRDTQLPQTGLRLTRSHGRPNPAARSPQVRRTQSLRAALRLGRLHAASRRIPAVLVAIAACAVGLRIALLGHWDAYGALQLPVVFETGAAAVITVATASPIGEPERVAGRWLPYLRLVAALVLTATATVALAAAGTGAHRAGGTLDVLRNVAGSTGIGLLCAAAIGAGLAWAGPAAYLLAGVYGLYTQWHHPALTTPWLWPARPPLDLGATICASLIFVLGTAAITVRGARDPVGQSD